MPSIYMFHLMLLIYSAVFFQVQQRLHKYKQVMLPPGRGGLFHLFQGVVLGLSVLNTLSIQKQEIDTVCIFLDIL